MATYTNTIRNILYNERERERLAEEVEKLRKEEDELFHNYDREDRKKDTIEECEKRAKAEWEAHKIMLNKIHKAEYRVFAAQFHRCRNTWFKGVIDNYVNTLESFNYGGHKAFKTSISEKQANCFGWYASDQDCNSHKTHESYCRIDDKYLIVLYRANRGGILKIIEL